MPDLDLVSFTFEAIKSGVIGNAAYEAIKFALGGAFPRLKGYADKNDSVDFKIALEAIMESNEDIKNKLMALNSGITSVNQTHYGSGDNVGRDKIVGK